MATQYDDVCDKVGWTIYVKVTTQFSLKMFSNLMQDFRSLLVCRKRTALRCKRKRTNAHSPRLCSIDVSALENGQLAVMSLNFQVV